MTRCVFLSNELQRLLWDPGVFKSVVPRPNEDSTAHDSPVHRRCGRTQDPDLLRHGL